MSGAPISHRSGRSVTVMSSRGKGPPSGSAARTTTMTTSSSPGLLSRVESADVDYWTTDYSGTRLTVSDHFPVFALLKVFP